MSLLEHAERELKLAGVHEPDADYGGALYGSVMELMDVFVKQGHSGASAARTIQLFKKVASYENLMPLTGKDDEWNDVGDSLQNNRVSSVFKDKNTGRAYNIDAIVWKNQSGVTYCGSALDSLGNKRRSRRYIRSFPFTPVKFTVDVVEKEVAKDDWEFTIKDEMQMIAPGDYYADEEFDTK